MTSTTSLDERTPRTRTGPLAGIRVADFCWMGVGSVATRLLGDFGAEVIKIEDRTRVDMPRRLPIYKDGGKRSYGDEDPNPDPNRGGLFNNYCRNKLGVTINMRSPKGRALADRLIAQSSVVTENFAPGVMERWGLTYGSYVSPQRSMTPGAKFSVTTELWRSVGRPGGSSGLRMLIVTANLLRQESLNRPPRLGSGLGSSSRYERLARPCRWAGVGECRRALGLRS